MTTGTGSTRGLTEVPADGLNGFLVLGSLALGQLAFGLALYATVTVCGDLRCIGKTLVWTDARRSPGFQPAPAR